jgi:hypothetical protein
MRWLLRALLGATVWTCKLRLSADEVALVWA